MSAKTPIFISGGAGYIGSHAAYVLRQQGFEPVVIDNLSTGNAWATSFGAFEKGDIGDRDFIRTLCQKYKPDAALHFAAFIEVGESVKNPAKYFENNRDKASRFFETLNECGVNKVVFSSSAAVYGDIKSDESRQILETCPTHPINPYGQSKLEAENHLRALDDKGMHSVSLRYFNVAGAVPGAKIGESHAPETHLIPRLLLPLIDAPSDLLQALDLKEGFTIYGNDYPTPDGTAIRDYIHVLDLIDAHVLALTYLLNEGETNIFNLGSSQGFSVAEIVKASCEILNCPDFKPCFSKRRQGDPAILVAHRQKAIDVLGWKPSRNLRDIIKDAALWHGSSFYQDTMRTKLGIG